MIVLGLWITCIAVTAYVAAQRGLNAVGYAVLAFFLGPLALLIVFLALPRSLEAGGRAETLPALRLQVQSARQTLARLENQLTFLETRLNTLAPPSAADAPVSAPVEAAAPAPVREGVELALGRYWLNRVGVLLFVLGVGFFISYSLRVMPAAMKITGGFALAGLLFLWGRHLEGLAQYRKFGWAILGGSWGTLYLTVFALHHISATRMIADPLTELVLLAAVSAAAVVYNLRYRSPVVTCMTFGLAFLTALFGPVGMAGLAYWILLSAAVVLLALRLQWPHFLLFSVVTAWIMLNAVWGGGRAPFFRGPGFGLQEWQVLFSMAAVSWFFFLKGLLLIPVRLREEKQYAVTAVLVNAWMFSVAGSNILHRIHGGNADVKVALFFCLLAAVYALFAWVARSLGRPWMTVVHIAAAFTLAALAAWTYLPREQVALVWLTEAAALFFLGLHYREAVYRWTALAGTILTLLRVLAVDYRSHVNEVFFGLELGHKVLVTGIAALAVFGMGALARRPRYAGVLSGGEKSIWNLAPAVSTFLATILLWDEVSSRWRTVAWTIEGGLVLSLGFLLQQRVTRVCALAVFGLAVLRLLFVDIVGLHPLHRIFAFLGLGVILVGASFFYTRVQPKEAGDGDAG